MHSARTFAVSAAGPALLASLLTVGCGLFQQSSPKVAAAAPAKSAPAKQIEPSASAPERHVGDLFVHRFSGSFASQPLTLTEGVVRFEDAAWVVEFSLSQN